LNGKQFSGQFPLGLHRISRGLFDHFVSILVLERYVESVHDFGVHRPIIVLGRLLKATPEALGEPYLQFHGIS